MNDYPKFKLSKGQLVKSALIVVLVIAATVALVFVLNRNTGEGESDVFNYPNVSSDPVDFEYLQIETSGTSAAIDVLRMEKQGENLYISKYIRNMGSDEITSIHDKTYGPEVLKEMQELIGQLKVVSWDGFSGKNPKGVLDGTMLSFEMKLADGSTITASGSNNFPKNYGELKEAIENKIGDELLEENRFQNQYFSVKLPENWVGKVYASYGAGSVAFHMATDENDYFLLLRLDFDYYEPDQDERHTFVGTLKNSEDELYLSIYNYKTGMSQERASELEYSIYTNLAGDIQNIAASAEAAEGWELVRK